LIIIGKFITERNNGVITFQTLWDIDFNLKSNTPIQAIKGHITVRSTSLLFPKVYMNKDFYFNIGSSLYYGSFGKIIVPKADTVRIDITKCGAYAYAYSSWGTAMPAPTIKTLKPVR